MALFLQASRAMSHMGVPIDLARHSARLNCSSLSELFPSSAPITPRDFDLNNFSTASALTPALAASDSFKATRRLLRAVLFHAGRDVRVRSNRLEKPAVPLKTVNHHVKYSAGRTLVAESTVNTGNAARSRNRCDCLSIRASVSLADTGHRILQLPGNNRFANNLSQHARIRITHATIISQPRTLARHASRLEYARSLVADFRLSNNPERVTKTAQKIRTQHHVHVQQALAHTCCGTRTDRHHT